MDVVSPILTEDEPMEEVVIKSEPIDPLIMDIEEEVHLEVPRTNLDVVSFSSAIILCALH